MKEIGEAVPDLSELGNIVPEGYSYNKKKVKPGLILNLKEACLKWYNLYPAEREITEEQVYESKEFIKSETAAGRLELEKELGFVILHRAGDYLLLLITTWRNTNEIWESIYVKRAEETESYTRIKFTNEHRGTYCVWELGIVWHERNAWVRFIESKQDEEAKTVYLKDLFSGMV
jgi:hypothetical protein